MANYLDALGHLRGVQAPITLLGETGVGKSSLAREIHAASPRAKHPFVEVNLACLSPELFNSELFGHAKGAFTGAHGPREGFVDRVGRGTLFLDEIGELGPEEQKRLLLLLEEKAYYALGTCRPKSFQGQFILATHCELPVMVKQRRLRQDLYYRINVFTHRLKSLRENRPRLKELLLYYKHFFEEQKGTGPLLFSPDCWDFLLKEYSWPGNIREVKNFMEYSLSLFPNVIDKKSLPEWMDQHNDHGRSEREVEFPLEYASALEQFEREYFNYYLKRFGGRINYTSQQMKISKNTLIAKGRKYGIDTCSLRESFVQRGA